MSDEVLYEVDGPVATITLNRPEQRNAVNPELSRALGAAISRFESDPDVWIAILTGAGPGFCAGADLKIVAAGRADELSAEPGGFGGFVRAERSKPVIAAVRGFALAGGLELVLACDLVVADEDAVFGLPEVTRGIIAGAGGVFRLAREIPAARARELVMTGDRFTGQEAHQYGLVARVVPTEEVLPVAQALARRICENAPLAVRESIAITRRARDLSEVEAWALSDAASDRIQRTSDAIEGSSAFVEKRQPQWTGN